VDTSSGKSKLSKLLAPGPAYRETLSVGRGSQVQYPPLLPSAKYDHERSPRFPNLCLFHSNTLPVPKSARSMATPRVGKDLLSHTGVFCDFQVTRKKHPNICRTEYRVNVLRVPIDMGSQSQEHTDGWPYIFLIPVFGYFLPPVCMAGTSRGLSRDRGVPGDQSN